MRSTKAWRQVGTRRIQSTQQGTPTKRPNPHQGAEEHPGYCTKARKGRRAQEACEARPREGEESADEGRQPKVRRTGEPERGAGPKGPGSAGHTRGKNRTAEEEVAGKKESQAGRLARTTQCKFPIAVAYISDNHIKRQPEQQPQWGQHPKTPVNGERQHEELLGECPSHRQGNTSHSGNDSRNPKAKREGEPTSCVRTTCVGSILTAQGQYRM